MAAVSIVEVFQLDSGVLANKTPLPRESPNTHPAIDGHEAPSIDAFEFVSKKPKVDEPFQKTT